MELRTQGLTGYRLNWKKAAGRPDIAFPGKKVAIFVHGCFWHRCPRCNLPLPKSNSEFWGKKFKLNQERDAEKVRILREEGWKVLEIWECEIKESPRSCADRVRLLLSDNCEGEVEA